MYINRCTYIITSHKSGQATDALMRTSGIITTIHYTQLELNIEKMFKAMTKRTLI